MPPTCYYMHRIIVMPFSHNVLANFDIFVIRVVSRVFQYRKVVFFYLIDFCICESYFTILQGHHRDIRFTVIFHVLGTLQFVIVAVN